MDAVGMTAVGGVRGGATRGMTFDEVIDVADVAARCRRLRRVVLALRTVAALLVCAALAVIVLPLAEQYHAQMELSRETGDTADRVAQWPSSRKRAELAAARAYNRRLASSGQRVLGEAHDPFATSRGASSASGDDSISAGDSRYRALLDTGGGVMGAVRVPKLSIDLPIVHGTSDAALLSGAGHLYGTSLPVGGPSTHAVLAGHRGLLHALMFTRLDEMRVGDVFDIDVMGRTLVYKVDRIRVVSPQDASLLTVVPGEDRVTLLTCTPYGVNTQRLLVSGVRTKPSAGARVGDGLVGASVTAVTVLAIGWITAAARRGPRDPIRHASRARA